MSKNHHHRPEPHAAAADRDAPAANWIEGLRHHLRDVFWRHRLHWLTVLVLIGAGSYLSHRLEKFEALYDLRYRLYRFIQNPWPSKPRLRDVVVVVIDDDEYWHGEPKHRVPIDRRYLRKIVEKVAEFQPAVIALDFDLRSPDPTGKTLNPTEDNSLQLPEGAEYVDETADLLKAIRTLVPRCDFVLPTTVAVEDGQYLAQVNVYDGFDFEPYDVAKGYISLPFDIRYIPPVLAIKNGTPLDSFAIGIVRKYDPEMLEGQDLQKHRFGSFIPRDPRRELTSRSILAADPASSRALAKRLIGKIVLIGADWHSRAYQDGKPIDSYPTPVGELPGVFIHANYIQAILDARTFPLLGSDVIEWFFGLLLAYALTVSIKTPLKLLLVIAIIALPIMASFLILQQLGIYCDVVIVDLLLLGHVLVERMIHK
jgi:CHASE2 domain-containing sensor protein